MKKTLSLEDFLGQETVIKNLKIFIEAAKKRDDVLDHVIIHGPPGLGKTTLANIIAKAMAANMVNISAPALTKVCDIVSILMRLKKNDFLFIDEIHRLTKPIEETLCIAMQDKKINVMLGGKNNNSSLVNIQIPSFTLVGATTTYGKISQPLLHRFGIDIPMNYYSEESMLSLLKSSFQNKDVNISDDAFQFIANVSRGIPRIGLKYLRRVHDFCTTRSISELDRINTEKIMKELGIDSLGLDSLDRKYLKAIAENYSGGPVGLFTLATSINETENTLENSIEPFLIRKGYISIKTSGRHLTENAIKLIRNGLLKY